MRTTVAGEGWNAKEFGAARLEVRGSPPPELALYAALHAAEKVLDNFYRVGTPCGHQPSGKVGAGYCATMVCDFYAGRQR